jgi:hypothetical protein
MSKGAVETTKQLVLAIVVIAVLSFFLITNISKGNIRNILCNYVPFFCNVETAITEDLRDAIKCSYYRCFDDHGCNSEEIEDLSWELDGETVYCEDFCDPTWKDPTEYDVRVCDHNSWQYPIEIDAKAGNLKLSRDFTEFDCFFDEESEATGRSGGEASILFFTNDFVSVSDRSDECEKFDNIKNSPTSFIVDNSTFYLTSGTSTESGTKTFTLKNTVLVDEAPYLKLTDKSYKNSVLKYSDPPSLANLKNRIVIKEGTEILDDTYMRLSTDYTLQEDYDHVKVEVKCDEGSMEEKYVCSDGTVFCDLYKIKLDNIKPADGDDLNVEVSVMYDDFAVDCSGPPCEGFEPFEKHISFDYNDDPITVQLTREELKHPEASMLTIDKFVIEALEAPVDDILVFRI